MATASKKSSEDEPLEFVEEKRYEEKSYCKALRLCNDSSHGIKQTWMWEAIDRSKSTYFILPEEPYRFCNISFRVHTGETTADPADFERFWFKLSNSHKERRLLANYMAVYNAIQERFDGENSDKIKNALCGLISGATTGVRDQWFESNKTTFRKDILSCFVFANRRDSEGNNYLMLVDTGSDGFESNGFEVIAALAQYAFAGALNSFFAWISLSIAQLKAYLPPGMTKLQLDDETKSGRKCQEEFMRKLSLAAPRWRQSDRQFMLQAIETNGQSCQGTYVWYILDKVGVERFKHLVFGKHRFCAHCNRSSYIGDDRLLACKRCDVEGIRPRAWYCDKECQRADWMMHKAAKHTPMEKKSKKKQKKKGKPRNEMEIHGGFVEKGYWEVSPES